MPHCPRPQWTLVKHRERKQIEWNSRMLPLFFFWFEGHWPAFRSSQLFHTEPSHRMGRPRSLLNRDCHDRKTKTLREIHVNVYNKWVNAQYTCVCVCVLPLVLQVRLLLHALPGPSQPEWTRTGREHPLLLHLKHMQTNTFHFHSDLLLCFIIRTKQEVIHHLPSASFLQKPAKWDFWKFL